MLKIAKSMREIMLRIKNNEKIIINNNCNAKYDFKNCINNAENNLRNSNINSKKY